MYEWKWIKKEKKRNCQLVSSLKTLESKELSKSRQCERPRKLSGEIMHLLDSEAKLNLHKTREDPKKKVDLTQK